ncbi:OB-fold protein [Mumia qirimensis]|uniref:OB-fold protein n=1 Tax=Mumia qirimensis TaxID=3234852 RepID=UPI00351CFA1E
MSYQQPYQPAPQPPKAPKKNHTGLTLALIGGGILVIGVLGAIGATADTSPDSKAASEPTTSAPKEDKKAKADPTPEPTEAPEPVAETTKAPAPKPKPAPTPKAVKVKAGKMLAEFEQNEAAADQKYKGKRVAVTGVVDKVDTEFWDQDEYTIKLSDGDEWAIWTVNCNDVSAKAAAKVEAGSTITVLGEFDDGGDLGVEIKDCEVVR